MKDFSHLNTATQIIHQYQGLEPLHHYLKKFFGQHKKFGSKDRRRISHLCYTFYRVGRAFNGEISQASTETIQRVILGGLFLCANTSDELLRVAKASWNEKIDLNIHQKVALINEDDSSMQFDIHRLFPAAGELSEGLDKEVFNLSHLHQPFPFLRIRPGYRETVIQRLDDQKILFNFIPPSAVRLPNNTKVDNLFTVDKQVVVQDLSSQRIGEFLQLAYRPGETTSIWDCCAASGGKSILAKDILGSIDLTVSDMRESILANLKKRFATAGISNYKSFVADLSAAHGKLPTATYDLLLADVPCTGSGTWGRTPEQLYFFQSSAIGKYSDLQKKILGNSLPHLKETGKLLYTTCSVFEEENEHIIDFILERFPLKIERMELLKGYDKRADTMFAALLSHL
jgi:16S rRNA (cytosine967-C5)-methyltransferase